MMAFFDGIHPDLFIWVVMPIFIFLARVLDVTLGTLRIIYLSRGKRYIAPALGFFEVFIWIVAVSSLVQNMSNIAGFLSYAAGFAAGNYIGLLIENKLAIGTLSVRIITVKESDLMVKTLHHCGYGVTAIDAKGSTGKVKVIYTIIKRKDLQDVIDIIKSLNPKAFFSVEEIRTASEGIFPQRTHNKGYMRLLTRGLKK
jgi:uncharacterized protein YebE (UPF0316 family)